MLKKMWLGRALSALLAIMACGLEVAAQEKRMALLIGNQAYDTSVGTLRNPHNDVALVGAALRRQGFHVLPPVKDGTRLVILAAIRDFARRLQAAGPNAVGFVYYSGHGAAEKDTNVNYVIPVDAREPGSSTFWDASLKLDDILRLLDGARSAAKFIVFDACRNELQLPLKDTNKGLMAVTEQQGMLVAFASAPGKTASDKGDLSGPFAAALAAELAKPGLDHLNLFQNVKEAVFASTGGAQQPWVNDGLTHRVLLTSPSADAAPSAPALTKQPPGKEAVLAPPPRVLPENKKTEPQDTERPSVLGRWSWSVRCPASGVWTGSFVLKGTAQRLTGSFHQDQPGPQGEITSGRADGRSVSFVRIIPSPIGGMPQTWTGTIAVSGQSAKIVGIASHALETCNFTATR